MGRRRYASLAEAEQHGLGGVLDFAAQSPEPGPDAFLLEAMREVDALTPSCPSIAPPEIVAVGSSWLNVRTNRWITDLHAPPLPPAAGTDESR